MPALMHASVAAALVISAAMAFAAPPAIDAVPVFREGEGGYHTYRIPSLLATPQGSLLAFCEGRRGGRGDAGDIDVVLRRSTDGGRTWGDVAAVWDDGPNTCGNPCPVVAADGRIVLLLTHNFGDDTEAEIKSRTGRGSRTVWVCESSDDGLTWSPPREITKDAKRDDWTWYATGPGVGIRLAHGPHAGRLVIPCDHGYPDENGTRQDVKSEYGSHVILQRRRRPFVAARRHGRSEDERVPGRRTRRSARRTAARPAELPRPRLPGRGDQHRRRAEVDGAEGRAGAARPGLPSEHRPRLVAARSMRRGCSPSRTPPTRSGA